jgi:hypothetical protein
MAYAVHYGDAGRIAELIPPPFDTSFDALREDSVGA